MLVAAVLPINKRNDTNRVDKYQRGSRGRALPGGPTSGDCSSACMVLRILPTRMESAPGIDGPLCCPSCGKPLLTAPDASVEPFDCPHCGKHVLPTATGASSSPPQGDPSEADLGVSADEIDAGWLDAPSKAPAPTADSDSPKPPPEQSFSADETLIGVPAPRVGHGSRPPSKRPPRPAVVVPPVGPVSDTDTSPYLARFTAPQASKDLPEPAEGGAVEASAAPADGAPISSPVGRVAPSVADRWDLRLFGHRARLAFTAGMGVAICGTLWLKGYVWLLPLYGLFLYLLLMSWLSTLRDDQGEISASITRRRLLGAAVEAVGLELVPSALARPLAEQVRVAAGFFGRFGLLLLLAAPALSAKGWSSGRWPWIVGWSSLAVSALLRTMHARHCRRSTEADELRSLSASFEVPDGGIPVLDVFALVPEQRGDDPGMHRFISVMKSWKPGPQLDRLALVLSLQSHLRRSLSTSRIELGTPVATGSGRAARADLTIARTAVIMLAPDPEQTDFEAWLERVAALAGAWARGPVVVLVAESRLDVQSSPVVNALAKLPTHDRRQLLCVAAGRRLAE